MTEEKIELESLEILKDLGWEVLFGPDIGPDGSGERKYTDAVLERRLRESLTRLNPNIPTSAQSEAIKKVIRSSESTLLLDNKSFHKILVDGVEVSFRSTTGEIRTEPVKLFDFTNLNNNDFVAVNQLTVMEGEFHRRPDIVLFVNGLPLGMIELKDPYSDQTDLKNAFNQLQTYQEQIPSIFRFNELLIISDGIDAEAGTISSNFERFMSWKTIDGKKELAGVPMLRVLLKGMCNKNRFLDIVRSFIVFEKQDERGTNYIKKLAAYHQYWAVQGSLRSTQSAIQPLNDHRAGVVWHTQGSGKSLSMVFYTGKLVLDEAGEFKNPTIVVVTDRNDLDNQLFETFMNCADILRQTPLQAESRSDLQKLLKRQAGGIIFTTNAKFFPERGKDFPLLSDRNNIIVVADEAHRSQYNFIDGFAKHIRDALPNASFIGFTGTPIDNDDISTRAVFGDYVDIYDIKQAEKDGATVPIFYESRLVQLDLEESMKGSLDKEIDELLEAEELNKQEEFKARNAQVEAIVGSSQRIKHIASDIVNHFENRLETMDGKGMIVVMSRRIAIELYNQIVALKPDWAESGFINVVITGSASDPLDWQKHIRSKEKRRDLADEMKDENSAFKLVIVCDMWLTGFDAPSLHTMYLDKPMKGHNLMQAIARINRIYKDKPGGLVVDYLGIAGRLRSALQTYTASGGEGQPTLDQAEAVAVMKEKLEIVQDLFHAFDYSRYFKAGTSQQLQIILDAQNYILQTDDNKLFDKHVLALSKAFALSVPHLEALAVRGEIAFFQAVRVRLTKLAEKGKGQADYSAAIRQIVDKAIAPAGVVDIFEAAGLERPNLSILSDEFLAEIRDSERKNLAAEALQKLLNDEIKVRFSRNEVKRLAFSEMLEKALLKYKNNAIEAAQLLEELIEIAMDLRKEENEAERSGLSADELAFYDALASHGTAKEVMGEDKLRLLAKLLVDKVRTNVTVDWTIREPARARLRIEVKKLLREYGYPPDQEKVASDLVLVQASLFAEDWSN